MSAKGNSQPSGPRRALRPPTSFNRMSVMKKLQVVTPSTPPLSALQEPRSMMEVDGEVRLNRYSPSLQLGLQLDDTVVASNGSPLNSDQTPAMTAAGGGKQRSVIIVGEDDTGATHRQRAAAVGRPRAELRKTTSLPSMGSFTSTPQRSMGSRRTSHQTLKQFVSKSLTEQQAPPISGRGCIEEENQPQLSRTNSRRRSVRLPSRRTSSQLSPMRSNRHNSTPARRRSSPKMTPHTSGGTGSVTMPASPPDATASPADLSQTLPSAHPEDSRLLENTIQNNSVSSRTVRSLRYLTLLTDLEPRVRPSPQNATSASDAVLSKATFPSQPVRTRSYNSRLRSLPEKSHMPQRSPRLGGDTMTLSRGETTEGLGQHSTSGLAEVSMSGSSRLAQLARRSESGWERSHLQSSILQGGGRCCSPSTRSPRHPPSAGEHARQSKQLQVPSPSERQAGKLRTAKLADGKTADRSVKRTNDERSTSGTSLPQGQKPSLLPESRSTETEVRVFTEKIDTQPGTTVLLTPTFSADTPCWSPVSSVHHAEGARASIQKVFYGGREKGKAVNCGLTASLSDKSHKNHTKNQHEGSSSIGIQCVEPLPRDVSLASSQSYESCTTGRSTVSMAVSTRSGPEILKGHRIPRQRGAQSNVPSTPRSSVNAVPATVASVATSQRSMSTALTSHERTTGTDAAIRDKSEADVYRDMRPRNASSTGRRLKANGNKQNTREQTDLQREMNQMHPQQQKQSQGHQGAFLGSTHVASQEACGVSHRETDRLLADDRASQNSSASMSDRLRNGAMEESGHESTQEMRAVAAAAAAVLLGSLRATVPPCAAPSTGGRPTGNLPALLVPVPRGVQEEEENNFLVLQESRLLVAGAKGQPHTPVPVSERSESGGGERKTCHRTRDEAVVPIGNRHGRQGCLAGRGPEDISRHPLPAADLPIAATTTSSLNLKSAVQRTPCTPPSLAPPQLRHSPSAGPYQDTSSTGGKYTSTGSTPAPTQSLGLSLQGSVSVTPLTLASAKQAPSRAYQAGTAADSVASVDREEQVAVQGTSTTPSARAASPFRVHSPLRELTPPGTIADVYHGGSVIAENSCSLGRESPTCSATPSISSSHAASVLSTGRAPLKLPPGTSLRLSSGGSSSAGAAFNTIEPASVTILRLAGSGMVQADSTMQRLPPPIPAPPTKGMHAGIRKTSEKEPETPSGAVLGVFSLPPLLLMRTSSGATDDICTASPTTSASEHVNERPRVTFLVPIANSGTPPFKQATIEDSEVVEENVGSGQGSSKCRGRKKSSEVHKQGKQSSSAGENSSGLTEGKSQSTSKGLFKRISSMRIFSRSASPKKLLNTPSSSVAATAAGGGVGADAPSNEAKKGESAHLASSRDDGEQQVHEAQLPVHIASASLLAVTGNDSRSHVSLPGLSKHAQESHHPAKPTPTAALPLAAVPLTGYEISYPSSGQPSTGNETTRTTGVQSEKRNSTPLQASAVCNPVKVVGRPFRSTDALPTAHSVKTQTSEGLHPPASSLPSPPPPPPSSAPRKGMPETGAPLPEVNVLAHSVAVKSNAVPVCDSSPGQASKALASTASPAERDQRGALLQVEDREDDDDDDEEETECIISDPAKALTLISKGAPIRAVWAKMARHRAALGVPEVPNLGHGSSQSQNHRLKEVWSIPHNNACDGVGGSAMGWDDEDYSKMRTICREERNCRDDGGNGCDIHHAGDSGVALDNTATPLGPGAGKGMTNESSDLVYMTKDNKARESCGCLWPNVGRSITETREIFKPLELAILSIGGTYPKENKDALNNTLNEEALFVRSLVPNQTDSDNSIQNHQPTPEGSVKVTLCTSISPISCGVMKSVPPICSTRTNPIRLFGEIDTSSATTLQEPRMIGAESPDMSKCWSSNNAPLLTQPLDAGSNCARTTLAARLSSVPLPTAASEVPFTPTIAAAVVTNTAALVERSQSSNSSQRSLTKAACKSESTVPLGKLTQEHGSFDSTLVSKEIKRINGKETSVYIFDQHIFGEQVACEDSDIDSNSDGDGDTE